MFQQRELSLVVYFHHPASHKNWIEKSLKELQQMGGMKIGAQGYSLKTLVVIT
ncbi:hypothetical protein JHU04_004579 [Brenneria sp. 4F2]|nr:hypothetical protein [Brenneria bubanii]